MNSYRKTLLSVFVSSAVAGLTACSGGGGGGGGGDATGLTMPDRLSVVTAKTDGSAKPAVKGIDLPYQQMVGVIASEVDGYPATSDYKKDTARTHVWDPAIEPLNTVNEILCIVDQTKASEMVNQGPYIALVDDNKCAGNKTSSGGQPNASSSATQAATYSKWWVESTREAGEHQYVRVWTVMDMGGDNDSIPVNLRVYLDIAEGVSAQKPFGDFSLAFAGAPSSQPGTQIMGGTLETVSGSTTPQFRFVEMQGTELSASLGAYGGHSSQVNVVFDDASGNSGRANLKTYESQSDPTTRAYQVAFNTDYFHRQKEGGTAVCNSRANPKIQVWQYNLYDRATGTRVDLMSSMPFTRDGYGNEYANVGYWGFWSESGSLVDGEVLTRQTHGQGAGGKYVAHVTDGKLMSQVSKAVTLDKFVGMQLRTSYGNSNLQPPYTDVVFHITGSPGAYQFTAVDAGYWDNTAQKYKTYGSLPVGVSSDITPANGNFLSFWGDGMNGWVNYVGGASNATLNSREMAAPGAVAQTTVTCYYPCLVGGLTDGSNPSAAIREMGSNQYRIEPTAGGYLLRDLANNLPVTFPANLDLTGVLGNWATNGMNMNLTTGSTNYDWETGAKSWNKQVTVTPQAGGTAVEFDPPLTLPYTYDSNDDANYVDAGHPTGMFLLQYNGDGQLWGFPGEQDDDGHWQNGLTLKDGVVLSDGTTDYVVKQIEREEMMVDGGSNCNSLTLPNNSDLPLPTKADIVTVPFNWTAKDTLDFPATPAVIGGVVQ